MSSFFDSFSRQHRGWHVHIEKQTLAARLVDVEDQPPKRVTIDRAAKMQRANIVLGGHERSVIELSTNQLSSCLDEPTLIVFKRPPDGAHKGIDISGKDGTLTTIGFRAAALPETLDGDCRLNVGSALSGRLIPNGVPRQSTSLFPIETRL